MLSKTAGDFQLILAKVIYSEAHTGDYVTGAQVEALRTEVGKMQNIHAASPEDEKILRTFERQMRELIACSLEMKKPIVF
jgi:hypothetical protein